MIPRDQSSLGQRAATVFDAVLEGRGESQHPADRAEAEAFWDWIGTFERPTLAERPRARWRHSGWAAVAAGVLAVAGLGGLAGLRTGEAGYSESFTSARGERRTVRLVDGSVVSLAPASHVDVAYTPGERRLRLTAGEALFEVAHNKARPFIVQVPHGEIRAVGTAFDVVVGQADAAVTVVEGVIRIALPTGGDADPITKTARKGDQVRFGLSRAGGRSVGVISQSDAADLDRATAWTRGLLMFHGEPLGEVVAQVNLYSRDTVALADPRQASIPVFAVLNVGDTQAVRELIRNSSSK